METMSYDELKTAYTEAQQRAIRYSIIEHPDAQAAREEREDLHARITAFERERALACHPE